MKSSKNKKPAVESAAIKPASNKKESIETAGKFLPHWLSLAIICLLGIIIYSNSFDCSFHLDDTPNIIDNKYIQNGSTIQSIWAYGNNRFWPYLSLAINYRIGGLEVWGYHFFNLMVHLINACVVYWIVLLIFSTPVIKEDSIATKKRWIAFSTALLFISHPLATQSVTYIVQRMASMVALFYLLSVAFYIKGRITEKSTKFLYYFGAVISAFFAFTSKENAYTLPAAILLTEFCFIQNRKIRFSYKDYRTLILVFLPLIFIGFALSNFSTSIFNPIQPSFGNTYTITWKNYLFTQFSVIIKYIQLLFLPINQNLDYDFPISNSLFDIRTMFSLIFLTIIIGLAFLHYKKNRLISFCILWFFLTLSIESSIIPIADVIFEHRTYLPSISFFVLIVYYTNIFLSKYGKLAPILVISFLTFCNSALTYSRNKVWKNELSLLEDIEKKSPNKARVKNNIGIEYVKINNYEIAKDYFISAIDINKNYVDALINLGNSYISLNDLESAQKILLQSIPIDKKNKKTYYNLGLSYSKQKNWEMAIEHFTNSIKIDSLYELAYTNRASIYSNLKKWDLALSDYSKSISLNVNYAPNYNNRGSTFGNIGKNDQAILDFTKAISLDSNYFEAYVNRGSSYGKIGDYDKALNDFTKATEINPNDEMAHLYKAFALSSIDKNDKAIEEYEIVLKLNPKNEVAAKNRASIQSNIR